MTDGQNHKLCVGSREWLTLLQLGIPAIKAKIDTGARSPAPHAFTLQTFRADGRLQVRFGIHPLQRRKDIKKICVADVIEQRVIRDSGGHKEKRSVLQTPLCMGDRQWTIEITLTDRDPMLFRMLLGRTAIQSHVMIDPSASFLTGRKLARIDPSRSHNLSYPKRKNGDPFGDNEVAIKASASGLVIGCLNLPLLYRGDALFHMARFDRSSAVEGAMEAFETDPELHADLEPFDRLNSV